MHNATYPVKRKKTLISFIALACVMIFVFSMPVFALNNLKVYKKGDLSFKIYTEGAETAFDGETDTAFEGSITGMFSKRSVITGITLKAGNPIINLRVKGSEDGVNWIELYERPKVFNICIFGDSGGTITSSALDEMYTYAFRYLRFELEYGSIAEIEIRGYEVSVTGKIAELDESFGDGKGYNHSGSFYIEDPNRAKRLFEHKIGSGDRGDVITYPDAINKFAFITVKLKEKSVLSAVSFAHKGNDKNYTRWNGVKFEASEDGEVWKTLYTLPADFSLMNDLSANTIYFIETDDPTQYSYIRISSVNASLSIGSIDVYVAAQDPEADSDKICNNWEGDIYIGANLTDITTQSRQDSTTFTNYSENSKSTTDTAGKKSGCSGNLAPICFIISICLTFVFRKKTKKYCKDSK